MTDGNAFPEAGSEPRGQQSGIETARLLRQFEEACKDAQQASSVALRGELLAAATGLVEQLRVLWPEDQAEREHRGARVHDRDGDGLRREIGDISRAELAELLRFWIDNAGPRSADELFEHANQSLGDLKLGQKLRERLQAGLQVAVCRGILEPSTSVVRRTHDRSHPQSP